MISNFLLLTSKEIKQIKEYLVKNDIKAVNRNSALSFNTEYNEACPFLTYDNTCAIYSVRPKICKEFECSAYCDVIKENNTDYLNVRAINMMRTFYPNEFCPFDDSIINSFNQRLDNYKKRIRR